MEKPIENITGKNLMDYFNSNTGEKNETIISSFKNISNQTFELKKNFVNTNKSWNKNNYAKINLIKITIKFINNYNKNIFNDKNNNKINIKDSNNFSSISKSSQKKPSINFKISNPKKSRNKISSIDIAQRLLSKHMPKKIIYNINNKNNIFINSNCKNIVNTKIIKNVEKTKKTPKSESCNKEISNPYIKIRESVSKNLFHDIKQKLSDEINLNKNLGINKKRSSVNTIKNKNPKFQLNDLYKMINKKNNVIKIKAIKKESIINKNININNIKENYSLFLENKDGKELQERNEKNEQPINIGYIFKSNNQITKNKK